MPYSELHRTTTNGTKMTNFSADLAFTPDNELVELVWENGQIMMQGQSSRSRKSPSHTSLTSKAQEKDGGDAVAPKFEKFGTLDSALNNNISSLSGPSGHVGLCEDYDMVPWLSYPLDDDDTLQHDYSSEFFPELTGATLDSLSLQNNVLTIDKNSSNSNSQLVRDTHLDSVHGGANPEQRNASASRVMGVGPEPSRPRGSPLCSSPLQQCLASFPSFRSRDSDFIAPNTNKAHKSQCQDPALTGGQPNTKMQKQGLGATKPPLQPSKNMGSTNFSHFLRPTAPFKTNLQSSSSAANPRLSGIHRMTSIDNVSAAASGNTVESMLIESPSGSTSVAGFRSQPVLLPGKVDLKPSVVKPPKKSLSADKSEAICRENSFRNTGLQDQALGQTSSFAGNTTIGRPDSVKDVEPAVASSSVCSGNNAGGASNDPKLTLKRKSRDVEDSEDHSEDVEEESVGVRKATITRGGTGARRTRAAEVHNLSERRRRDRINEKMRALQELIPNCNKVDKASMLDEAIEYLKTLQFQVQIMSLGAGMYMPPLMLPTGMHAPPFSHMGVGMGMGMGMGVGFGMGMYDMSGGRPLIQVPPMHGMQFHCPPISSSLPMMAGCSPQMLGFPNQGIPMSMPCAPPYVPLSEGPSIKSVSVPDVSRTEALVEVPDTVPPLSSKDSITNTNLQMMTNTSDEYPQNQMPSQATIEGFEQSAVVATNDQTPHISTNGDVNSANGNETN